MPLADPQIPDPAGREQRLKLGISSGLSTGTLEAMIYDTYLLPRINPVEGLVVSWGGSAPLETSIFDHRFYVRRAAKSAATSGAVLVTAALLLSTFNIALLRESLISVVLLSTWLLVHRVREVHRQWQNLTVLRALYQCGTLTPGNGPYAWGAVRCLAMRKPLMRRYLDRVELGLRREAEAPTGRR